MHHQPRIYFSQQRPVACFHHPRINLRRSCLRLAPSGSPHLAYWHQELEQRCEPLHQFPFLEPKLPIHFS